jgi:DEAD/DEAH box helicase domain-containing protein
VIVIDELHTYRGVFGSHVANVLRRLLRLCRHYGSNPIIVCSSATIGNPAELAAQLTGRSPRLIDRNGAPAGAKHLLLVDPPLLDPATGARGSALTHAERWALPFIRAGRQTIVFGRARVAVEIILSRLREALREHLGPRSRIRGYRGGYLPTERRAIERGLRDGEILGVVSTNALELGVDIGALDVSILAGYPGSVAGTWQQLGRAGRRQDTSVGILIASGSPVDQYVIHHPEFLLESSPEEARADPDNLHVLLAHLRCATFERPFEPGEVFGPGPVDDLLAFIGESGHVRQSSDGRWYWSSENFPASEVSLRTAAPENVVIIDNTPDRPRVLGETDLFSAQVLVHTQAIYLHESVQYHVDYLDWGERKAYVRKVDVDYYTYANRAVTLKPLDVFASADATGGRRIHGEVMVASLVTLFKKLKFGTDENVGWGPIDLPELELQTTAYWLTAEIAAGMAPDRGVDRSDASAHVLGRTLAEPAPGRLALGHASGGEASTRWRKDDLDVALLGAGRAIQAVAAVLLMVDPRDLGLVTQVRSPHSEAPTIYLYEAVPGGVGLSERLFNRHDELIVGARDLIEACACVAGCPACTGPRLDPEVNGKQLAVRLLTAMDPREGRAGERKAATSSSGERTEAYVSPISGDANAAIVGHGGAA